MKRILSADPVTGSFSRFTAYWGNDGRRKWAIENLQDAEPIAETTKASFNSTDERANWKGDWHLVASIPNSIYYDLQRKGITKDPVAMKKWLNERDNRVFRTRPGKV